MVGLLEGLDVFLVEALQLLYSEFTLGVLEDGFVVDQLVLLLDRHPYDCIIKAQKIQHDSDGLAGL